MSPMYSDGNGAMDFVASVYTVGVGSTAHVCYNEGGDTQPFTDCITLPGINTTPTTLLSSLLVLDADSDGDDDILLAFQVFGIESSSESTLTLALNGGNGTECVDPERCYYILLFTRVEVKLLGH